MSKKQLGISVATVAMLLAGLAGAVADENVWVTEDEEEIVLGHGGAFFISEEDAEAFDVAELADGETRTFGEGEKQVTVTRNGDEVTMILTRGDGDSDRSVVCQLSSDECKILQIDDDPGKMAIMIRKSHECSGSEEDCGHIGLAHVSVGEEGPGRIVIRRSITCDEDGNCEESEDAAGCGHAHAEAFATVDIMADDADLAELHNIMIVGADDDGHRTIKLVPGNRVALRCPEGDTTMTVDRDEADETFLCPRHSVPLEKVDKKEGVHKIMIRKKVSEDDLN